MVVYIIRLVRFSHGAPINFLAIIHGVIRRYGLLSSLLLSYNRFSSPFSPFKTAFPFTSFRRPIVTNASRRGGVYDDDTRTISIEREKKGDTNTTTIGTMSIKVILQDIIRSCFLFSLSFSFSVSPFFFFFFGKTQPIIVLAILL